MTKFPLVRGTVRELADIKMDQSADGLLTSAKPDLLSVLARSTQKGKIYPSTPVSKSSILTDPIDGGLRYQIITFRCAATARCTPPMTKRKQSNSKAKKCPMVSPFYCWLNERKSVRSTHFHTFRFKSAASVFRPPLTVIAAITTRLGHWRLSRNSVSNI
jgi:hypothetical protein